MDEQRTNEISVEPMVAQQSDQNRYEISLDGESVGRIEYLDRGKQRIFYHTEVDDRFSGRGLASTLVAHALRGTRTTGKRVVPVCPFVAEYVRNGTEFTDVTDPVTPAALAEVRMAG